MKFRWGAKPSPPDSQVGGGSGGREGAATEVNLVSIVAAMGGAPLNKILKLRGHTKMGQHS